MYLKTFILWFNPFLDPWAEICQIFRWFFGKGEMHKKADEHIWLPFLQFLSNFNETLSIRLFFQGRMNRALKSELTQLFFS